MNAFDRLHVSLTMQHGHLGLHSLRFLVLLYNGPTFKTLAQLAQLLGANENTLTDNVRKLAKEGLIVARGQARGRAPIRQLSPSARELMERIAKGGL